MRNRTKHRILRKPESQEQLITTARTLIRSQAAITCLHGNECCVIERFIGTTAQRSAYYALLDACSDCSRIAVRREEQDRAFQLVNQRRSSNLGFRTFRAEQ